GHRGLHVLGVVVAAVDDDHVLDPAGDVQLAVEVHTQVAGAEPQRVLGHPGGVTADLHAGLQLVAVRDLGLAGATPLAETDVVAVKPDLTDPAFRQFGRGLPVDDRGPLAAGAVPARHVRHSAVGVA